MARIARFIRGLPVKLGETVLLGLSGGPDSVALLHALQALQNVDGFELAAAHLNHCLRGSESDRDEAFVRELCARLGVKLIVGQASSLPTAGANLEERARESRHEFLETAAGRVGAAHVMLAHTADDQAETVLMRFLRGAGPLGLGAMAPCGPGRIVRPMLGIFRDEVLAYLEAIDASFVVDSSNGSAVFLRNRLRSHLLPAIEREYAPGLRRRLVELAGEMRAEEDAIRWVGSHELARRLCGDGRLRLDGLEELPTAVTAVLMRLFVERVKGDLRAFSRRHFEALMRLALRGPASGRLDLPQRWRAERCYGFLSLERFQDGRDGMSTIAPYSLALAAEGTVAVEVAGGVMRLQSSLGTPCDFRLPVRADEALFDADAAGDLVVRNPRNGDRMKLMGLGGRRKLQDLFVDRKVPRAVRGGFPVVVSGEEVLWVPGIARSDGARVVSATRSVRRVVLERVAADEDSRSALRRVAPT